MTEPTRFDPRQVTLQANELSGRIIAITGATGGIGRALAIDCARRGAQVILIARNVKKLEGLFDEIISLQTHAGDPVAEPVLAPLDLEKAVAGDYDAIASAIEERWGRLDGLVHCAAQLGHLSAIEHQDVPTWVKLLHVNVTAMFALTQVLLPLLRASPDASIVCTSSSVGRRGRAYWGGYAVSKFALEGFVQTLADELGLTTVRVNSLNPGKTRTTMRRQAYPSEDVNSLPLPETIVPAFVALLGPQSKGINGGAFDAQ